MNPVPPGRRGASASPAVRRLRRERQAASELGAALPGTGLAGWATQFGPDSDWPEDLRGTPVIVDTDIGGDPAATLALAAASLTVRELRLVITCDETGKTEAGERARFARHLLDLAGRHDVTVVEGAAAPAGTRYWHAGGLIPASTPPQAGEAAAAVRLVLAAARGRPVRWVGMGPLTNLAGLAGAEPELLAALRVTQIGGAVNYRDLDRAEHNFRLDPAAVRTVLEAAADGRLPALELVTSDITRTEAIEVTAASGLYNLLAAAPAGSWAALAAAHLARWFTAGCPSSRQRDALALTAALELPFVTSAPAQVAADGAGRVSLADGGAPVRLGVSARYGAFMNWLTVALDPAAAGRAAVPAAVRG